MNFFPEMTIDEKDELFFQLKNHLRNLINLLTIFTNKYILNRDVKILEKRQGFHFDLNYDDE